MSFSIGQVGKAFRNEITPGNFTYRTIEFEQMEYQTFCKPDDAHELYKYFMEYAKKYLIDLGVSENMLRYHPHEKLAHYAKEACDIEYLFPFGWGEINGTHNRTNYDLSRHQEFSKTNMEFLEPETNEKYVPYIVESTFGVDRLVLTLLFNGYKKEILEDGSSREYMCLHPYIAPYKIAVLPLRKKNHGSKAREIYNELRKEYNCDFDEAGTIGKRYRREDMLGTPWCITIDDNTLKDNVVTLRNRDTMQQIIVNLDELKTYVNERLKF